jgi:DNA-binding LacI/PurR family transcriptional regulator
MTDAPSRPITSHDVAKRAGVSQSAVSRAFTPGGSVSPAMRARIDAAASALGYMPNLLPRMMLKGRIGIVAVISGDLYNPFHAKTLDAFARDLHAAGYKLMLVPVEGSVIPDGMIDDLLGYRVDGVVTGLSILTPPNADRLSSFRIPVVALNSPAAGDWIRNVRSDNEAGGREAATLLHARGGRRFAFLAGPDSFASRGRQRGFVEKVVQLGHDSPMILPGDYTHQGGMAAARMMLACAAPPDAIFCVNDLSAMGVIDGLRAAGRHCPGDAMVVGYDNINAAAWPSYDLTTFDQQIELMTAAVVEMLGQEQAADRIVPSLLVERGSTKRG